MNSINLFFGIILDLCYHICNNFGGAIILFTLLSKIVLFPLSLWLQKNSIKIVSMTPELNKIKIHHYGDAETIAEEQQKLYKEHGYNPFITVVPTLIQIIILLGLIGAVRETIAKGTYNIWFLGLDLSVLPYVNKGVYIISPLAAGLSSLMLSISQNKSNILQAEQSKGMQYFTMGLSVGISLILGWYVPGGVALYWVASNLFSMIQQWILNKVLDPMDYVDEEELEKTKKELEELKSVDQGKKRSREDKRREKADYKRFFSIENKHLVFYSESSGFYKYFKGIIEYILDNTNVTIHYITSDPQDQIFELSRTKQQIKPYYIGENKLITLMMKMEADIVVMTMPDLENYHIKRSYIKKDIDYIFIPHSMCSLNLTMRKGSTDHFDTVFCTGKHQVEEALKTEEAYQLPKRKLVQWGYSLLDDMREDFKEKQGAETKKKTILIAPSWQKDNIVDSCLDEMLDSLKNTDYNIVVRPHPQHVRHQPERMEFLKRQYENNENIEIQTDFSLNNTVYEADLMITDWSGIAYEYSFATYRPVIFIDTPMKIMNPEYQRIDTEPFNIWMRDVLGKVVKKEEVPKIANVTEEVMNSIPQYRESIKQYAQDYVYNLDHSAEVGGEYIIQELQEIINSRK